MQEERGLPLPKEPSSVIEDEDFTIAEILEPSEVRETSGKDESNLGLFVKPSWSTDDSENLDRLPRRRTGRGGQGILQEVKFSDLNLKEPSKIYNGISKSVKQVANEEVLLKWISTSDGVRLLSWQSHIKSFASLAVFSQPYRVDIESFTPACMKSDFTYLNYHVNVVMHRRPWLPFLRSSPILMKL